jgi:hypothetical protein
MVMTTKINSDHPTSTTLHKVTNGLYAIRIEMCQGTAVEKAFNSISQGDYLWLDSDMETDRSGRSEPQTGAAVPRSARTRKEQQKTVIDARRREVEDLIGFNDRLLRKLQLNVSSFFDQKSNLPGFSDGCRNNLI